MAGLLLLCLGLVAAFASARSKSALKPYRLEEEPLLYHPGNALDPYLESTYRVGAGALLKRFRRQTSAAIVLALVGALLMALSE